MKKIVVAVLLVMTLISIVGCTKKEESIDIIGSWKAVSIECEEEDLKADVLAGNITIIMDVDDKNMTMKVNEYVDPPVGYTYSDGELAFAEDFITGAIEGNKMIITVVFDEHTYEYLLEKVD